MAKRSIVLALVFCLCTPLLAQFTAGSLGGTVTDPTLELHDASGGVIAFDDNWQDSQATAIEQTGLAPGDPREAAIVQTLSPGPYTAVMRGKNGGTGIGLIEVYDADTTSGSVLPDPSSMTTTRLRLVGVGMVTDAMPCASNAFAIFADRSRRIGRVMSPETPSGRLLLSNESQSGGSCDAFSVSVTRSAGGAKT